MKKYQVILKSGKTYYVNSTSTPNWSIDFALQTKFLTIGSYGSENVFKADDVEAVLIIEEKATSAN